MSYLMKFERRADKLRDMLVGKHPVTNPVFYVQWRSVAGLIEVNHRSYSDVAIFQRKHSRLGQLFRDNKEQECYFVAQAVRKALSLPVETTFKYWLS
jgi:hypothetical protein